MNRVCCGAVKIFIGNKSSPLCTFLKVRVCVAMKAPVGLLSGRAVLRKQDGGALPRQAPALSKRLCVRNLIAIYNDPFGYADLILNGDPKEYLKNATGNHRLEI